MTQDVLIVADDLSGAAESAAELAGACGVPLALSEKSGRTSPAGAPRVRAVDVDTRHSPPAAARLRTGRALGAAGANTLVFAKLDSLLRGNPGAAVDELRRAGRTVVVSAAHPGAGRTVRAGVSFVDGVALHETAAWAAEEALPPRSVAAALGGPAGVGGFRVIPLAVVRSASALREAIAECARTGAVAVCDAETPEDLSAVAEATLAQSVPVALAGTAALARALAGLLELPGDGPRHAARPLPERPVLVVAGTRAPSLDAQFATLAAAGATAYDLDEAALARAARGGLPHDGAATTAVRLARGHAWRAVDVDRLAAAVVPLAQATGAHLVLTGGETARRVLGALGVDELTVVGPLGAGAVLCRTADGRAVVTRPGSFGGDGHLVDLTARLRALMTET